MEIVARYFLFFIIYSFLGWVMEVTTTLISKKKLVNRGFLIGPYCPIYGWGVLAVVILIGPNNEDILSVFLKSILICSILEYMTSFFMEKIFNVRWWDYSQKRFNINGRICLETMLPFGILSCAIVYLIHPNIVKLVNIMPPKTQITIAIILLIVYIIDNILSTHILFKIKSQIKEGRKDNTEKIKKCIEKWLKENSVLYRRITMAFPKFQVYIKEKKEKIKQYGRKKTKK